MDDLLEVLIRGLLFPYDWWKNNNENSRLGTSPMEEETERFWLKFSVVSIGVLVVVAFALHYAFPQWFPW